MILSWELWRTWSVVNRSSTIGVTDRDGQTADISVPDLPDPHYPSLCDLVGSTALSARFDPEDLREELRACQNAVSGVVARYDGFVAKFMGDGVLAR